MAARAARLMRPAAAAGRAAKRLAVTGHLPPQQAGAGWWGPR